MFLILQIFISTLLCHADYRAYELQIINPETGKERKVISTLDQYQYPQYYPLFKGEVANYIDSWMCWGNFSYYQKICPNPKTNPPGSANISPNQKPISSSPAS